MTHRASSVREDIVNLPNLLTLGRIAVIPIVCWLLASGDRIACVVATALFGAAAFTDWLDGYIARRRGLVSMTGKFLDPLADKLLVMAVFCTLLAVGSLPVWFVVLSLAREMSVTGLRALAAGEGMIISAGWGGKWKTAFQLVGLVCLMLHFEYTLEFGLFELVVRMHNVGFALLLLALAYSLTSGWEYFRGFLTAIDETARSQAA